MSAQVRWLIGLFAAIAVLTPLAWRGVAALPGELDRHRRQVCLPLEPSGALVERPASGFSLKDYAGRTISLDDYKGRVVLLNFFATWCQPCVEETPSLERLAGELASRSDFALVSVSEDKSWNDVRQFFSQGSRMTILMDEEWKVSHAWGTQKLPETYLIDKHGVVRHYVINKRNWSSPQAIECLRSLLDE